MLQLLQTCQSSCHKTRCIIFTIIVKSRYIFPHLPIQRSSTLLLILFLLDKTNPLRTQTTKSIQRYHLKYIRIPYLNSYLLDPIHNNYTKNPGQSNVSLPINTPHFHINCHTTSPQIIYFLQQHLHNNLIPTPLPISIHRPNQ